LCVQTRGSKHKQTYLHSQPGARIRAGFFAQNQLKGSAANWCFISIVQHTSVVSCLPEAVCCRCLSDCLRAPCCEQSFNHPTIVRLRRSLSLSLSPSVSLGRFVSLACLLACLSFLLLLSPLSPVLQADSKCRVGVPFSLSSPSSFGSALPSSRPAREEMCSSSIEMRR
jgi:hypothetical protein